MGFKKLALIFLALAIFLSISSAHAIWLYPNETYKQEVNVTNNDPTNYTDMQVAMNVTYNSSMNSDFSDLRFSWLNQTDGNETAIPYWIENETNNSWAYIWVKIPFLPASDNATIYMYFGDENATSESNGTEVFEFFDDFNTLNTTIWNETKNASVSDGILHLGVSDNAYVKHYFNTPFTSGFRAIVKKKMISSDSNTASHTHFTDTNDNLTIIESFTFWDTHTFGFTERNITADSNTKFSSGVSMNDSTWYRLITKVKDNSIVDIAYYGNLTYITNVSDNSSSYNWGGINKVGLATGTSSGSAGMDVDYIAFAKYIQTNPSIIFGNTFQRLIILYPQNKTYYKQINYFITHSPNNQTITYNIDNGTNQTANVTEGDNNTIQISNLTLGSHTIQVWGSPNNSDKVTFTIEEENFINETDNFTTKNVEFQNSSYTIFVYAYSQKYANITQLVNGAQVGTYQLTYNSTDDNGYIYSATITLQNPLANTSLELRDYNNYEIINYTSIAYTPNISWQPVTPYLANTSANEIVETSNNKWSLTYTLEYAPSSLSATFKLLNGTSTIYNETSSLTAIAPHYTLDTNTFKLPQVDSDTTMYGKFIVNISDAYNDSATREYNSSIIIQPLLLLTSSTTGSSKALEVYFKDEDTEASLTNVNVTHIETIQLPDGSEKQISGSGTFSTLDFYIYPSYASTTGSVEVDYSKEGYTSRQYYNPSFTFNNVLSTLSLMLLNSSEAHEFIVQLIDEAGTPISNYYIFVNRFYSDLNAYKNVEMRISNDMGEGVFHLRFGDTPYQITIANSNGTIIKQLTPMVLAEKYMDGYADYQIVIGTFTLPNITNYGSVQYTIEYNNDTQNFKATLLNIDAKNLPFCMDVYKKWGWNSQVSICHSCVSSIDQVMLCHITDTKAEYKIVLTGSGLRPIYKYYDFTAKQTEKDLTTIMLPIFMGITIFIITLVSPVAGLISIIIWILVLKMMGAMNIGNSAIGGLAMAIAFVIWWLLRGEK